MNKLRSGVAAVVVAAVAVLGVASYQEYVAADVPHSTTGEITGCQNDITGLVRLVDAEASETCGIGETTVSWLDGSQAYEPDHEYVYELQPHSSGAGPRQGDVDCPSGKKATGGGAYVEATNPGLQTQAENGGVMVFSVPNGTGGSPDGWVVKMDQTNSTVIGSGWSFYVYAVCTNE